MAEITEMRAAYGEYSAGLSHPDTIWMLRIMDTIDLVKIALIYVSEILDSACRAF